MAWLQFIEAIEIYPVPVVVDAGSDNILELLLSYCFWKLYQVLTHLRLTLFCRSVPEAIKEIFTMHMRHQGLLLSWINFNPSMDK